MIIVVYMFTADITTDKEHEYKRWSMGYFLFQIASTSWKIRTGLVLLWVVKNMLPAMYIPLLFAFSLAKSFCKITNFYYLKLLIETVDGAVAVSIHHRFIKIIHWHNASCKSIALVSNQPLRESSTRCIRRGKGGQGVALRTLQPPFADWIEIRVRQSPGFS